MYSDTAIEIFQGNPIFGFVALLITHGVLLVRIEWLNRALKDSKGKEAGPVMSLNTQLIEDGKKLSQEYLDQSKNLESERQQKEEAEGKYEKVREELSKVFPEATEEIAGTIKTALEDANKTGKDIGYMAGYAQGRGVLILLMGIMIKRGKSNIPIVVLNDEAKRLYEITEDFIANGSPYEEDKIMAELIAFDFDTVEE